MASYAFDGSHESVEATYYVSDRSFALEVRGDSMEPEFREGDVIIVDPSISPDASHYVIAELLRSATEPGAGEITFKQYRPRGINGIFDLVPLNPAYPTITVNGTNPGRVIGVVAEHKRNLLR